METTNEAKSRLIEQAAKMLSELERRRDALIAELKRASPEAEDKILIEVMKAMRAVYALGHDLVDVTGKGTFRRKFDIEDRIEERLVLRARRLRAGPGLPVVGDQPWKELIDKLRSPDPPAVPFDPDEDEGTDYVSRTGHHRG